MQKETMKNINIQTAPSKVDGYPVSDAKKIDLMTDKSVMSFEANNFPTMENAAKPASAGKGDVTNKDFMNTGGNVTPGPFNAAK